MPAPQGTLKRRQAVEDSLEGVAGAAYILELYRNITDANNPQMMADHSNTIMSAPYTEDSTKTNGL